MYVTFQYGGGRCDLVWFFLDAYPTIYYSAGVSIDFFGDRAATFGSLPVVELLHEMAIPGMFSTSAMNAAAGSGYIEVVRFLHESRSEGCTTFGMDDASKSWVCKAEFEKEAEKAKEVVFFLLRHRKEGCTASGMERGHTEVLRVLYEAGMRFSDEDAMKMFSDSDEMDLEDEDEACAYLRQMHGML
ncbi:hypothetical protein BDK51DRAFT_28394 [Blyttiomyces helicus]|uniref:Ankyrin repeat-containing domain protein n=1 Tax=Blyttiomyces helicus TaxID=388810 RepID=A0A4P9WS78_9FUNG|nr:hypothetical protein BDK51DRAFT_28394 [Blyttiomyces helicus]|eukprot:RKO94798.1 hypothetical protein BDK51DRAFT_28394 [Blyttiomyces helicus]